MRERNTGVEPAVTPRTAQGSIRHGAVRAVFALLALTIALLAPSGPASARDYTAPASAQDDTFPASQAAHLAGLLRTDPVYVTDQLPRDIPRSIAPEFVKAARRTGVPTYVLVLPRQLGGGGSLLGAVHDRLGRDGLYVLVDDMGVAAATAYGVRAPADDASTVALYELPYDAGPLLSFQRFTEVIAEGSTEAAQRAEKARKTYSGEDGSSREPAALYIGPTDRDNQSFLTGILLTGIPLLILLLPPYVRRRLRRRAEPPGSSGRPVGLAKVPKQAKAPAAQASARSVRRLVPRLMDAACALVAAVVVVLVTLHTFDQTTSSAAPPPTAADMSARVDRVAAGLRQDPLYTDPESPRPLDTAEQSELRKRMGTFRANTGPVYLAVVPQLSDDESGDNAGIFSSALHQKVGKDGVYIVADPLRGDIAVENYGLRLDDSRLSFGLPASIRSDHDDSGASDFRLGARLDQLMTLLDKTPRTSGPHHSGPGAEEAPDPVEDNTLHPLFFRSDFWPGVFVGLLAGAAAFGVAVAVISATGGLIALRSRRHTLRSAAAPGTYDAPADPSGTYLRRTARSEITLLGSEFASIPESVPDMVRTRAWDCLDAATLLVDREPDGRIGDDAGPPELAAAIVLARAGRAALATGAVVDACCSLNPLHGPTGRKHEVRYEVRGRSRRRSIPVCERCGTASASAGQPGTPGTLRLTLPGAVRGERTAYEEATGPLPAARNGITHLLDAVREYAGVQ
ncbi:hypothetical protein [Streptomyces sp. NBC_00344]|uniref:hypothetical protein n=1 Tax=Streptomyces sp. NBC_00344 TaxID=2975720 RepID=UPI002E221AEB